MLRDARLGAAMTQAELARRSGLAASNISAYENGRRPMSPAMLERLLVHIRQQRPSESLARARTEMLAVIQAHGGSDPAVFGSAARANDTYDSDLDLLVTMAPGRSLIDLAAMQQELEDLLGVKVDLLTRGALRGPDDVLVLDAVAV